MKTHNYKVFKCFSRKFRIGGVEPPPYVKLIFAKYSGGGTHMGPAQFRRFLAEVQGQEGCTVADAERVMEEVARRRHNHIGLTEHQSCALTLDDFFHYLLSDDLNQAIKTQVHHDMTAPLPHYFIYTGHNSYLTGNQISSDCSDVPIIKALLTGVRVIELDIWPNSTKDDIQVIHGSDPHQMLEVHKEYAFIASPYPVIITLEDHLTPDLQAKVAEMVTQTFGDMLYYPESGCLEEFPSPESLKYKIIISTKPPKEDVEAKRIKGKENPSPRKENSSPRERDMCEESSQKEVSDLLAELEAAERESESYEYEENSSSDGGSGQSETPKYKLLITIQAGKPKGGLKNALRVGSNEIRRLSLSEQALEKAAASHGTDLVRFTQKNVLRIYPKGTRVNSSNYKPMLGWMHGAQMVAFNMQGYGKSLWLMHGMFRCNGGCGYIKKPDFLMKKGPCREVFNPKATLPVKTILKVGVYMGDGWSLDFSPTHFDTYSPPDFYTKIHIVGVPADNTKRKTKIINNNWFPVWDEAFIFSLTVPELALLRIEVREHDRSEKDDFGGQTCLPVSELRPGIRSVPLFDKKGEKYKSVRLLMEFEFL
ncbi:hypothetical protein AAG906_008422 [Vitis piasezkii]